MDKEFITLDSGFKIHFKEFGKGPSLLLIHGWNNDWSGFAPLIKYLEDKFHVIAVDLPGYGFSDELKETYSIDKMCEILSEFIEKKNGKKIDILCALSMGTVIASGLSTKHMKNIKSVVLIGPPIIKYDWIGSKLYREWIKFMNKNLFYMKAGHRMVSSRWYGHFTAKYINMYKYDKKLIDTHGMRGRKNITPRALFQMGMAMYNYNLSKIIKDISIPMLIILGKYDKIIDLDEAGKIDENKKNVTIEWVDDAGHVVSLEKPEETAKLVEEFAQKLDIL